MSNRTSRRHFISIVGAAAGLSIAPGLSLAAAHRVNWTGKALGGEASISLYHHDKLAGEKIVAVCASEITRLEKVFSLFRRDSALVRLNKEGQLSSPPIELVSLIRQANDISQISNGAFDVTVQPLWALYAHHFSQINPDPDGPGRAAISKARTLINWRNILISEDQVSFAKSGMAITMNGIAQGYITDRIAEILQRNGIRDTLVNLGEFRGTGKHPDGRPWRIGVSDPLQSSRLIDTLELKNQAVASSGGYGTTLDSRGRFHHLFSTQNGLPSHYWSGVTVIAKSAAMADALSTALAVMEPDKAQNLVRAREDIKAILVSHDGTIIRMET
ncbi:MAG: FAD:protein FMN transferase [Rhodospirillaceae bacterium]|jgi:FAD:protein FMN transferase|nr:FAD:protein FMN transferase [Rhodospirillaceae bacterium]MBT7138037.1 FAD:protein FMN transferase [Rhodospirillaceae bacterium]